LIGLANFSKHSDTIHLSLSESGLNGKVAVCNFWKQSLSIWNAEIVEQPLQGHASALLGIRTLQSTPAYIGSTLHASMGMEVIRWEATADHIQFDLELNRHASGFIWLHLPAPPLSATINASRTELVQEHYPNIYRLAISFTGKCHVKIDLTA
jgi:hypothetical protein